MGCVGLIGLIHESDPGGLESDKTFSSPNPPSMRICRQVSTNAWALPCY